MPKPPLFHDVVHRFPERTYPDPGPCPVCGAAHTACTPDGYVPPAIPRSLPVTLTAATPPDLPADEYEWADQGNDLVRVKHDLYVTITYQGSKRTGRSLLYPKGMLVPREQAIRMRALYAQDQALHPGETK